MYPIQALRLYVQIPILCDIKGALHIDFTNRTDLIHYILFLFPFTIIKIRASMTDNLDSFYCTLIYTYNTRQTICMQPFLLKLEIESLFKA